MIESADEYKSWFDADPSDERLHMINSAQASNSTWQEVADRFPECRAQLATHRQMPLSILSQLRHDDDEGVKWRVRRNHRWLQAHPDDAAPGKTTQQH